MTIHNYKSFFISFSLLLISCVFVLLHALPSHSKQVPPDSFFVLSLKTKKIIEQSSIKKSLTWAPILHDWGNRNPSMLEFLIDMNASGVNFDRPIHFFSRLQGTKNPDPVIGVLATVQDKEMVDSSLHAIAETLKIKKKPSPFTRFGNEFLPYEFFFQQFAYPIYQKILVPDLVVLKLKISFLESILAFQYIPHDL